MVDRSCELLESRLLPAVITPFTSRFSANTNGDILFVANTLMTAPASDPAAVASQAGSGTKLNDNDFSMVYVDVDGVASTFNSSRANLALPAGATVLFAGLYWGANSASSSRNTVLFQAPGASGYSTLSGVSTGADSTNNYQAFADVTTQVRTAGVGTYSVANVQANTGGDRHAGWALVVVYGDPSAPPRNLTVFDGLAVVNTSTPSATININGFTAPPTGVVNASVGVVAYEGDLGFTGDVIKLNGATLSDALNPANNFFNSSITHKGSRVASKNPDYVNQLGFDADVIGTTGVIPNGATSASISLATTNETYLPGVVTTAIDLYAPVVSVAKGFVDLNGGDVTPGDVLEFTDSVVVTSGEAATRFVLLDAIPSNTTFVPGSLRVVSGANAGTKSDVSGDDQAEFDSANNRIVFRLGTGANASTGGVIGVGATSVVRFRVRVNDAAPNGAAIQSQASATFIGQSTGAALAASSALASATVIRHADLSLAQAVDDPAPNVGGYVVVTTTLNNAGPFEGTGILVNAALPSGLLFDSVVFSQGAYDPATGAWAVGGLAVGGQATLSVRARVVSPAAIATTASIGSVLQPDPVSINNSASTSLTPQRSDLALTKAVDDGRPDVGGQVVFTTTLVNRGPNAATNISIADALPAGFTLLSAVTGLGTYDQGSGAWSLGTLASGGSVTLVLTARVDSPSPSASTATILLADQYDPIGANNAASALVSPRRADVEVSTGVDNAQPTIGDVITYTVTVRNNGPDAATGVDLISSGIPSDVQILSVVVSQGTFDTTTTRWSVGSIPVGASQTLVARARVNAPSIAPLIVSVEASDQYDPNTANNTSRSAVDPQEVSLSVTNTVSDTRPDLGELVTFTISVRNVGPATANGVVVESPLPSGLEFVSASPGQGAYDAAAGTWAAGSIGTSTVATLTLVARVVSPDPASVTASIVAGAIFDENPGDNTSTVELTPTRADLLLTLTGTDPSPNVGDEITLLFTLSNQGPDTATGVVASGSLPAGVTLLSYSPSQGTFDPVARVWSVGTVDTLSPRTLVLRVRVDSAEPLVGTASIVASDQYDPNAANNVLTVTAIPQQADLSVFQAVDVPNPNVGEVVTFAVTVANAGPDAATGLSLFQVLPAGLEFVSASPGQGTYDAATGVWVVGALGASASQVLYVRARVTGAGAAAATAGVVAVRQFDPTPAAPAAVVVTPQRSNLALTAVLSVATPQVGGTVAFTFTLSNDGPDAATGVAVRGLLTAGLAFDSALASQGAFDPASGTWSVGAVASGASATFTLFARVASPSAFTGAATIIAADQYDPDPGSAAASVSGAPQVVDVGVTKTVDVARSNVGDVIVLTTYVSNSGPSTATNLLVRSFIAAGLTVLETNPSQGSYDPATGVWNVGDVQAGGGGTLRVVVRVDSPNAINSLASVIAVDQFDSAPGNSVASTSIVPQRSDIALAQAVDVPNPNVGQVVTFTITASALGPDAATGVRVLQSLPAGLQFVSSNATSGGYDPATGVWTIGAVAIGSPETIRIVARVTAAGVAPVTASVLASDQYDPNPSNNAATTSTDPQSADLGVVVAFDSTRPNVGDVVTYTVTVRDAGPSGATGLVVSAPLPAGLELVDATPGQGTYDAAAGTWTIGPLGAGAVLTLQLTARVTAPTVAAATAGVIAVDQFDPSTGDNAATAAIAPQRADLAIALTSNKARPNVGDVVTLEVSLSNVGPDAAGGVTASVPLPAGLTFIGASGAGAYDAVTGAWSIGNVAQGAPAVLRIQVRVDSNAAQAVTATVVGAAQFDPAAANDVAAVSLVPQQADLSLSVSADRPTPNVGELVTFSVVVVNHGADDSTGVRIASAMPAGLSLVSATASQGVFSLSTGAWEAGHLASNGAAILTIQARVASPAASVYSASIVASDQFDPTPADRLASASVTPQGAGLSLTASASTTTPNVGDVVALTLTLANGGPDAATNISIASIVPAGYTLASAVPSRGVYDPVTGHWRLPDASSGSTATLALTLVVASPDAGTYSATIVASDQYDPDRGDDLAGVTIVPQRSDLALSASVSDPAPNVGDAVTFTFILADLGPGAATGVAVSAPLPAGYTLVSASAGAGSYDSTSGLWTVGAAAPGSPATLTLSATVDVASPASVSATILAADQYDPTTANNSASASVFPRRSDLGLAVLVSNPAPNLGETVTYTIRLTNTGPDAATNIVLRDVLPAGVTLVSAGPGGQPYDPATGLWPVGSLAAGGELILTLTVTVDDPDATVNRVEIAAVDQYDPTSANNAAETSTEPQQAELRLTGSLDQPHPNVGGVVTISFTLANLGIDDATGVLVDALLPAGLTLASATPSLGSYDLASGLWTIGDLADGATATLTITAVVASAAPSSPRASIRQADQYDPNLANNSAALQLSPQRADVDIAVSVDTPRPNVGDLVVVTVTAVNRGPDSATAVSASSALPAGLSFVSAAAEGGAYDAASGTWSLGTLASGTSSTLRITARVVSAAASTVTAAVVASDQFDPDRAGDVAAASLIPLAADLSLTATIDDASPRVGQVVSITVTLANQGPDAADGVLVSSLLPAGLSLVSASSSRGSYDSAAGVWDVGSVGGGAGGVLVLRALVTSPGIGTALAAIAASNQFDPDSSDDSASVAVTPGQSNLNVALMADTTTPNVGDVVTLTVSLTNAGPTAAGGTILLGDLPAGLAFIGAASSQGSFSPDSGTWVVGEVAPGESRTLTIQVRVVAPGPLTASIQVAATDQHDPDPSDNSASITLVPRQSDLSLASTVDVARPNVGDLVTITITLTDSGPDAATGVRVASPLPAGLELVQAIPSVGAYNPATGAWEVGTVAAGSSQTLRIIARVISPDASVVTSLIAGSNQFDPDPSDDSAATGVIPQRASLGLNATIDNLTPGPGEVVTYTVVLTNAGPDAATGVRASNLLPAGLQFVSADALAGAFDPQTGTWDVGAVAAGGSATLVIRVRPISGEPALATVAVVAADQFDAASGVQASVAILPRQSDVGVSIVADDPTPDVGDVVTFTIRVGAQGPDAASGVAAAVAIPPGLTYLSAEPGQGSFDPAAGTWTIGSMPVSGVAVLTIRARVASPSASTVTATVTGDEFDPDATDDAASLTLTPTVVDLSVQVQGVPASIVVGRSATISITVVNNGANPASGVSLPISVPAGFRLASAAPGQGAFDPAAGLWVLGDLPAGGQATLALTLEAVAAGSASIAAGPARSDQFDADASNDAQAVAVTIRPADAAPIADLGLGFRPLAGSPRVGRTFVAYLQLTNAGPDAATNVAATLAIPAGLRLVSATADVGVFDPISGLWTLGAVPSGGGGVLAVTLEPLAPGEFRLAAGPVRGDQLDSDSSNDAAASALVATAVSEPPTDSASLQGAAFIDLDGDGRRDPGEPPIVGATVILRGVDSHGNALTRTTSTDADGLYRFASLPAGTYTLELSASSTGAPGTLGGRAEGGRIVGIVLGDGAAGVGYSFLGVAPSQPETGGSIGGRIYIDLDRSGSFGPNDYGVATVLVNLKGVTNSGSPVWRQTVTSADGSFSFDGLEPGRYSLRSVRPGFLRAFRTTPGSAGGAARGDHIENITIREGETATGYAFGTLPGPGCRLAPLVIRPGGARGAGDATLPARFRQAPRGPLIHRFVPGVGRPVSSRLGGDGRLAAVVGLGTRRSGSAPGGGAARSPWAAVRRPASTDR